MFLCGVSPATWSPCSRPWLKNNLRGGLFGENKLPQAASCAASALSDSGALGIAPFLQVRTEPRLYYLGSDWQVYPACHTLGN